jgi:UDP-glucose:(heptosyl)LPS alpha-1,3-glucosyltransferase
MRVGLVLEQLDPTWSGTEHWSWQFAANLVRHGHEVHIVVGRCAAPTRDVPVILHPLDRTLSRLGFARAAEAALNSLSLDVVHDMGPGWHCDVFQPHGGSWLSYTERKLLMWSPWMRPLKRWIGPILPRQRAFRSLVQRQYTPSDKTIVAVSRFVAADIQRLHRVPARRIRIVYNGVDTERFSPDHRAKYRESVRKELNVGKQTLLALIVAHNFHLKGVPTSLRAVQQLTASRLPVHLLVVGGKQSLLGRWKRIASRLGIGESVTFVGRTNNTVPYYAAADVYVHPTLYDPCSLVLLEAAASGLPIVTSRDFNGAAELLTEHGDSLLISDPANARELADRVEVLLDDSVREQFGCEARRMALRHTFDRNVEQILEVYREILPTNCAAA